MPVHANTDPDHFALAELTPESLAAVTGEALGEHFTVEGTTRTAFPYNWGAVSTAGIWRVDVSGRTATGSTSYAFFVKLLRHPRHWPHLGLVPAGPPREMFIRRFPWRLELDLHQAGVAELLPPGLRAPQLHHVREIDDDHVALWSQFVEVQAGEWGIDNYTQAAFELGRLAARRRLGDPVNERLPSYCRVPVRDGSLRYYVEHRVQLGTVPALRDGAMWAHPVLSKALAEAADPSLPDDMVTLADQVTAILDLVESMPQTYAHGDASPQNLLIPVDAPGTKVVIDWGFCTPVPVGFDLGQLLVGLVNDRVLSVPRLPEIFDAILDAYVRGLATDGYDEDREVVRLGFVGSLVIRTGLVAVPFELLDQPAVEEHHDLFVNQLQLTRYLVELAATLPL